MRYNFFTKTFSLKTEAVLLVLLFASFSGILPLHSKPENNEIVLAVVLYLLFTIILLFTVSPDKLLINPEYKNRFNKNNSFNEFEKAEAERKGIFYITLFKYLVVFIPIIPFLSRLILGYENILINISFIVLLIIASFCSFTNSFKHFIFSQGYSDITFKKTLKEVFIYYDKNEKRAILEKMIGVGTTVNLATKEGRLILFTLLSIPAVLILIFLLVFVLNK